MSPVLPYSVGSPRPTRTSDIEVLATGFGPFRGIEKNPSYEIVSRLPDSISSDTDDAPTIRVRKLPEPIKVSYSSVAQLVPKLYSTFPAAKYFVHIGVHGSIHRCRLERKAKKGPYTKQDVDGRTFSDVFGDEDGLWEGGPEAIDSQVNVDAIVERMMGRGDGWDIEVSDDPGLYLCEFIYYSSLFAAQRFEKDGRSLRGIFVHVPPYLDPDALDKERDTVVQVIREMVKEGEEGNGSPHKDS
ncbi:hypothetical protein VUR80DRAFT_1056 [Thermomyces stellatus]